MPPCQCTLYLLGCTCCCTRGPPPSYSPSSSYSRGSSSTTVPSTSLATLERSSSPSSINASVPSSVTYSSTSSIVTSSSFSSRSPLLLFFPLPLHPSPSFLFPSSSPVYSPCLSELPLAISLSPSTPTFGVDVALSDSASAASPDSASTASFISTTITPSYVPPPLSEFVPSTTLSTASPTLSPPVFFHPTTAPLVTFLPLTESSPSSAYRSDPLTAPTPPNTGPASFLESRHPCQPIGLLTAAPTFATTAQTSRITVLPRTRTPL
ncbi:hypothetical protein KP509_1Z219500 [Ceratopteris richardii]|nr:hypothetical protein KP509_1Z219500 [Ceratopteris richardii]